MTGTKLFIDKTDDWDDRQATEETKLLNRMNKAVDEALFGIGYAREDEMPEIVQTHKGPTYSHKPGSPQAVSDGCSCSQIDNHHGKGVPYPSGPAWWVDENCPLHGGGDALPVGR